MRGGELRCQQRTPGLRAIPREQGEEKAVRRSQRPARKQGSCQWALLALRRDLVVTQKLGNANFLGALGLKFDSQRQKQALAVGCQCEATLTVPLSRQASISSFLQFPDWQFQSSGV